MRSNLNHWKEMQENEYFEKHVCYNGLVDLGDFECQVIEWFANFDKSKVGAVVGCGYGRESAHIAKRIGHLYGIDVSRTILDKADAYLSKNDVKNFTSVLAEEYAEKIPDGLDLVFSIVVFQHITRDLAKNYLEVLGSKLKPDGKMIIQFTEDFAVEPDNDADLRTYEPSVSYNIRQVVDMAQPVGLKLEMARSYMATPAAIWHWCCLVRA